MRPVNRGAVPREYARYQDAIEDLEERLGCYCSYCERRLPTSLAVEHVSPKSVDPASERSWDNFLLGCTNCNSVKSNKPTSEDDFLWPDRDNTARAFCYGKGGFVKLSPELGPGLTSKASQLMDIVGLNRHAASGWPLPAQRDKRWKQREEVWSTAERARADLETLGPGARDLVVDVAAGYGFFSVWLAVFQGDPETVREIVNRMPGTATNCFDGNMRPIRRPGGRL